MQPGGDEHPRQKGADEARHAVERIGEQHHGGAQLDRIDLGDDHQRRRQGHAACQARQKQPQGKPGVAVNNINSH